MRRILFAVVTITFVACSSQSSVEATQDSLMQSVDTQRGAAVTDSVAAKADTNKRIIDSSFKALKDSIQKVR